MADYFCYEFDFAGRPVPVIYYDELPFEIIKRKRVQVVQIDKYFKRIADNEYDFATLKKHFPYIPPETEEETTCQDQSLDI